MPILRKIILIDHLRFGNAVIRCQISGNTQADSLVLPSFRANCMNWTLGHIFSGRDTMLELCGWPKCLHPQKTSFKTEAQNLSQTPIRLQT